MDGPFRVIGFGDLRDAMEMLMTLLLSEEELHERGIALTEHDTLLTGLGASDYTLVELATGEQYLLHRLEQRPETLNVHASLDANPAPLVERFLACFDVPRERIEWTAGDEFWPESRQRYNRDDWLHRRDR